MAELKKEQIMSSSRATGHWSNDPDTRRRISEASRERINRVKPWLKATGPRTEQGKAASSLNNLRTGIYSKNPVLRRLGRDLLIQQEIEQGVADALAKMDRIKQRNPRLAQAVQEVANARGS